MRDRTESVPCSLLIQSNGDTGTLRTITVSVSVFYTTSVPSTTIA